jgi:hypothetical protein
MNPVPKRLANNDPMKFNTLEETTAADKIFRDEEDECIKIVLKPSSQ